jgi:hypothetical protein
MTDLWHQREPDPDIPDTTCVSYGSSDIPEIARVWVREFQKNNDPKMRLANLKLEALSRQFREFLKLFQVYSQDRYDYHLSSVALLGSFKNRKSLNGIESS